MPQKGSLLQSPGCRPRLQTHRQDEVHMRRAADVAGVVDLELERRAQRAALVQLAGHVRRHMIGYHIAVSLVKGTVHDPSGVARCAFSIGIPMAKPQLQCCTTQ